MDAENAEKKINKEQYLENRLLREVYPQAKQKARNDKLTIFAFCP